MRKNKKLFSKRLIAWHKKNKRNFAWRKTRNPYKVIVAEIMLQKTDAKKVSEVYGKFIADYPTIEALSEAPLRSLRKKISPLGIHQRANRLKKLATEIVKKYGGKVPSEKKELLKLPGVGNYVANAVLCFAFGRDVPLVDANIIRVLERVFSIKSSRPRPRTDKNLWTAMEEMIPKSMAREFNLALLDFAAKVCTAKEPKHKECPVKSLCDYYKTIS